MTLRVKNILSLLLISTLVFLLPVSVLAHGVQQKTVEGLTLTFSTTPLDIPVGEQAEVLLLVRKEGERDPIANLVITLMLSQGGQVYNEGKLIDQGRIYQGSFTFTKTGVTDAIIEFSYQGEHITTRFLIDVTSSVSLQTLAIGAVIAVVILGAIGYIYRSKQRKT